MPAAIPQASNGIAGYKIPSATLMGRIRQTVATDTEPQTDPTYAGGREERESYWQFV